MPAPVLVFDLGKVLLDFDYRKAAAQIARHSDSTLPQVLKLLDQSPLLYQFETGLLTTREFFTQVRSLTGYRESLARFATDFGDIFEPIPPMIDLLIQARSQGYPTVLLSNTNSLAIQFIRKRHPFYNTFDAHILSYRVRSMKPDAHIYSVVEARTRRQGADLVYVDDRPENVEAAARRGWRAILHRNPRNTRAALKRCGLAL